MRTKKYKKKKKGTFEHLIPREAKKEWSKREGKVCGGRRKVRPSSRDKRYDGRSGQLPKRKRARDTSGNTVLHTLQLLRTFCGRTLRTVTLRKKRSKEGTTVIVSEHHPHPFLSLFSALPLGPFRRNVYCCGCVSSLSFA